MQEHPEPPHALSRAAGATIALAAAAVAAGIAAYYHSVSGAAIDAAPRLETATELPLGLDFDPATARLPYRIDARTVELGQRLFFDTRLSRSGEMSCATCHRPELGFTDGRRVALGDGGEPGTRNVPTVLHRAMGTRHFWDGRAADLAEQALGPLLAANEMALTRELFDERIGGDPAERAAFESAYGAAPTLELAAQAIAAFEATLVAAASPFDRFEWLGETDALSPEQRRGLELFRGKAGCSTCHVGTNFSDESFHNLGIGAEDGFADPGRAAISGSPSDRGAFKTPSLRNVARTAPYMHDGSLATLSDVIAFYDAGGRANPALDPEIRPLGLSAAERAEIEAFLHALAGEVRTLAPSLFAPPSQ